MKIGKYFILVIPILIIIGLVTAIYMHYKSSKIDKTNSSSNKGKPVQPFRDIKDLESLMNRLPLSNKPAPSSDKEKKAIDDIDPELRARIDALKKKLEERLAKIKTRSPYRKVLRGQAENGNAWDYYTKAFEILKNADFDELSKIPEIGNLDYSTFTEEQKREVREIVKKYKGVIELIKKGATQGKCDRGDKWEEGFEVDYLSTAIQLSKFASRGSLVIAEDSSPDEAMDLVLDSMRFGQDNSINGALINNLIGVMGEATSIGSVVDIMNNYDIDTQKLNGYIDEINILIDTQPSIFDAIETDAVAGSSYFVRMAEIYSNNELEKVYGISISSTLVERNINAIERYIDVAAEIGTWEYKPYSELKYTLDSVLIDIPKSEATGLIAPAIKSAVLSVLSQTAKLDILKTALATKIYQQENNVYPQRLSDIGYIINPMPTDTITGELIKYMISEDGSSITIYSVGPNLKDDGGIDISQGEDDISITLTLKKPAK